MAGIRHDERCLQATECFTRHLKPLPCLAQLIPVGAIFGVIDDNEVAPGQLKAIVERFRFGAGTKIGDTDDLESGWKRLALERGKRFIVIRLAEEEDFQPRSGPVQLLHGKYDLRNDRRLLVKRDHDAVDGLILCPMRLAFALAVSSGGHAYGKQTKQDACEKEDAKQNVRGVPECLAVEYECNEGQGARCTDDHSLRAAQHDA